MPDISEYNQIILWYIFHLKAQKQCFTYSYYVITWGYQTTWANKNDEMVNCEANVS